MPSLSARALRRRPDLVAARAWRATVPGSATASQGQGAAVLLALVSFSFLYVIVGSEAQLPWAVFLPALVVSGVIHKPGEHLFVIVVSLGCVAVGGVLAPTSQGAVATFVAGSVIASVTMWRTLARARVGVRGRGGELLLDELREGLERRGVLPPLPGGWRTERCISSAHGHPFSGDFIVSHRTPGTSWFEVVVVDVSGKGLRSASRAVQLSGALDALLGAVPAEDFLPAANAYVVRQRWVEGFATAVHLLVDLESGEFQIRRAGHPPAAVFRAGDGRWHVVDDRIGPALGLVEGAEYPCDEGDLQRCDALLLYSDGLVEKHDRTLEDGIDRLLGKAEFLVPQGFAGGSLRLCEQAASGDTDDRAVVLLWNE